MAKQEQIKEDNDKIEQYCGICGICMDDKPLVRKCTLCDGFKSIK